MCSVRYKSWIIIVVILSSYSLQEGPCHSQDVWRLPKSCAVRCFEDIEQHLKIKPEPTDYTEIQAERPLPHVVSIRRRHRSKCAGVVISKQYVLSTAVCLSSPGQQAAAVWIAGSPLKNVSKEFRNANLIPVEKLILHPGYVEKAFFRDIGLIKLSRELSFNSAFYPACLNLDPNIERRTATLATYDRQQGNISISEYDKCNDYMDSRTIQDKEQFCGSVRENCYFHAGSPVHESVPEREQIRSILGLISIRKDCKHGEGQVVFTRISAFAKWIEEVVLEKDKD